MTNQGSVMTDDQEPRTPPADGAKAMPPPHSVKLFRSQELFSGEKLVYIEHAGAIYRLQITSRGKLILQK